jgi:hypothetical protein
VVSDRGGVLVIDDPLSLLSAIIWLTVLGTWPVAFLFGACSPCCQQEDPCPWLLNFDRCLRVSFVGSDPPDGGDCRIVSRRAGSGLIEYMAGSVVEVHRVQSKIVIQVRLNLSASGSSRTPVGQTRAQVWRFNRNTPTNPGPESFDVLGPDWHLQVDLSVTGVATQGEAAVVSSIEQDSEGQPKLVLQVHQWTASITHDESVTLFPVGMQRWAFSQGLGLTQSALNAQLISGVSYSGWFVTKLSGLTIEERKIAARVNGTLCLTGGGGTVSQRILLDEESAIKFLSGDEELRVSVPAGQRDIRVIPDSPLCEASSSLVSTGIALGIYPEKVYADVPPSLIAENENWCAESATFALTADGFICADRWSAFTTYIRPRLAQSAGSAFPSSFWIGKSLLWNAEHGPYRTSFTGDGPAPPGTSGNVGGWVYRLEGNPSNLDPFFLSPVFGCRSGLLPQEPTITPNVHHSGICYPNTVTVSLDFLVPITGFSVGDVFSDGLCQSTPKFTATASFSVTETFPHFGTEKRFVDVYQNPAFVRRFLNPLTPGREYVLYGGIFGLQEFSQSVPISIAELPERTDAVAFVSVGVIIYGELNECAPLPDEIDLHAAVYRRDLGGNTNIVQGGFQVYTYRDDINLGRICAGGGDVFSGDEEWPVALLPNVGKINISHIRRTVCEGDWLPNPVPAEGATIALDRDCQRTDGEVTTAVTSEPLLIAPTRSRLPRVVGGVSASFLNSPAPEVAVTQLGRCRLTGLRDFVFSSTGPVASTVLVSATANQCFEYLPLFGETSTAAIICGGDSSASTSIPCEGCTITVATVSGGDNASVRYIASGDKAGVVQVVVKRTWLAGQGVTFTVTCGDDTITQVIRRAPAAPTPPRSLTVTRGPCSEALLQWEAPEWDGGEPITAYNVQFREILGVFATFSTVSPPAVSATVTGLSRVGYEFRISATNSIGTSNFSNIAVDGFLLGVPTGLTAAPRDPCSEVSLSWTPPAQSECVVVAEYRVQFRVANVGDYQTFTTVPGTVTAATVTGLIPGTSYQFRIARVSELGGVNASSPLTVSGCPPE